MGTVFIPISQTGKHNGGEVPQARRKQDGLLRKGKRFLLPLLDFILYKGEQNEQEAWFSPWPRTGSRGIQPEYVPSISRGLFFFFGIKGYLITTCTFH